MASQTDIHQTIADVLNIDAGEISPASNLRDELEADSVDLIEIASLLEQKFEISIEDDEMFEASTPADLAALVDRKKSGR